jgi:dTDP-4-dehydrorhamnose reductase
MQSILATGATGLVGSRFVEMFNDKYNVANMDLTTGVDITRVETFKDFIESHTDEKFLIHLAAFTDPGAAFAQTGDKNGVCYKVNVEGTRNIAAICKKYNIHLIHVSTDFVFDGENPPEGGYTEDSPRSPIEWYGETKALAEEEVENSGASYTIVRISYPYRANYDLKPDLIRKIRAGLESGDLPPQFTDSTVTPTLTDDIALAFDKIIQLHPQGIFHAAGSSSLSPFELAQKVAIAYDFDPNLVKAGNLTEYLKTSPRPFARHGQMNNQKTTKILELHFATIEEGLTELRNQQTK